VPVVAARRALAEAGGAVRPALAIAGN